MTDPRRRHAASDSPAAAARGEKALALAAELRALAANLERQACGTRAEGDFDLIDFAHTVRTARRDLDRAAGLCGPADPVLDILLGAYAGRSTADHNAFPETARRRHAVLEQGGLLVPGRSPPLLTDKGRETVRRFLARLAGRGAD